jgi:hypothetical protein
LDYLCPVLLIEPSDVSNIEKKMPQNLKITKPYKFLILVKLGVLVLLWQTENSINWHIIKFQ